MTANRWTCAWCMRWNADAEVACTWCGRDIEHHPHNRGPA